MKLRWLDEALHNLEEQIDYIERDSPGAADRLENAVTRQARLLATYPELGRKGRVHGTRELVISRSSFILVYRIRGGRIEILRVLHGARRYPSVDQ